MKFQSRLCEIFGTLDETPFAGKSILVCSNLYQLPFLDKRSMINAFRLRHLFILAELSEIMRQKCDNLFIDLLNSVKPGATEY